MNMDLVMALYMILNVGLSVYVVVLADGADLKEGVIIGEISFILNIVISLLYLFVGI